MMLGLESLFHQQQIEWAEYSGYLYERNTQ
jgi:hypothetical protein